MARSYGTAALAAAVVYYLVSSARVPTTFGWFIAGAGAVACFFIARSKVNRLALMAGAPMPVGVVFVLSRTGWEDLASEFLVLTAALFTSILVFLLVHRLLSRKGVTGGSPGSAVGALEEGSAPLVVWHGRAWVATGLVLPLGEGVGYAAMGLSGLLVLLRFRGRYGDLVPRDRLPGRMALALACYVVAGMLAIGFGGEGFLEPGELGRLGPWAMMPIAFFTVTSLDSSWTQRAVVGFVAVLTASAALGLVQYGADLSLEGGVQGMLGVFSSKTQTHVPGYTDLSAAGGFYLHRLKLAHVLLVGIAILGARQLGTMEWRQRGVELAMLGVQTAALFVTFTRGALLGLLAGALVLALSSARGIRGVLALVVVGAMAFTMPSVRERALSMTKAEAFKERAVVWSQGAHLLSSHSWGVGLSNYPKLVRARYDVVAPQRVLPRKAYAHNVVLTAWAETGPLGVCAYVFLWALIVERCLAMARRRKSGNGGRDSRTLGCIGVFALVAWWVVGQTHDVIFHNAVHLVFAATVGTLVALSSRSLDVTERA